MLTLLILRVPRLMHSQNGGKNIVMGITGTIGVGKLYRAREMHFCGHPCKLRVHKGTL